MLVAEVEIQIWGIPWSRRLSNSVGGPGEVIRFRKCGTKWTEPDDLGTCAHSSAIFLLRNTCEKKNVSCATISSSKYWLLGSSAVIKWSTVWKFSLTSITSSVIPFEATVALNSLLFCCDGLLTLDAVVGHSWINFRQESFRMKMKRWFSYGDQWSNDSIELVFHLLIHTSSCLINSLGSH